MRRSFALSLALFAWAAPASAENPPAPHTSLHWIDGHAEKCVSEQDLAARVEYQLGYRALVAPGVADTVIEGTVTKSGRSGYRANLVVKNASGTIVGERKLESTGPSCEKWQEILSLVIALMIDPNASMSPRPPPASPPPPPPKPPPVVSDEPPKPAPAPPRSTRISAEATAATTVGLLPNIGFGAQARFVVEVPGWIPMSLGGAYFFERAETIEPATGALDPTAAPSVDISLAHGELLLCPFWSREATWRWSACGGSAIGAYGVRPSGLQADESSGALYADARLAGSVGMKVGGPVFLTFSAAGLVPIVRKQFVYTAATGEERALFRASPVAGSLALGIGIDFL